MFPFVRHEDNISTNDLSVFVTFHFTGVKVFSFRGDYADTLQFWWMAGNLDMQTPERACVGVASGHILLSTKWKTTPLSESIQGICWFLSIFYSFSWSCERPSITVFSDSGDANILNDFLFMIYTSNLWQQLNWALRILGLYWDHCHKHSVVP